MVAVVNGRARARRARIRERAVRTRSGRVRGVERGRGEPHRGARAGRPLRNGVRSAQRRGAAPRQNFPAASPPFIVQDERRPRGTRRVCASWQRKSSRHRHDRALRLR